MYSRRAFIWYAESSCTSYTYGVMREEKERRKKERKKGRKKERKEERKKERKKDEQNQNFHVLISQL